MSRVDRLQNEVALIQEASILSVLSILILRFQEKNGSLPDVIYLDKHLQMPLVCELINTQGLPAQAAVLEPVWLHGFGKDIPLLYSPLLGDQYVQLINQNLAVIETL